MQRRHATLRQGIHVTDAGAIAARLTVMQEVAHRLDGLRAIGTVVSVERGGEIYAEGDRAESWYRLLSGVGCTSRITADGRRQIGGFLFADDVFGFDAPERHGFGAEALTAVTLMRFPRTGIEALAREDADFGSCLRQLAYDRLSAAHGQLLLLGRKSSSERLATFILEMRDRMSAGDLIELPVSRVDIADYLGLTFETVSRTFSLLRQLQMIALPSPSCVRVLDCCALGELAAGDTKDVFPAVEPRRAHASAIGVMALV